MIFGRRGHRHVRHLRRRAEAGTPSGGVAALADAKEIFFSSGAVKTKVIDLDVFWPAEKYHQDYYRRNGGDTGFTGRSRGETSSCRACGGWTSG